MNRTCLLILANLRLQSQQSRTARIQHNHFEGPKDLGQLEQNKTLAIADSVRFVSHRERVLPDWPSFGSVRLRKEAIGK